MQSMELVIHTFPKLTIRVCCLSVSLLAKKNAAAEWAFQEGSFQAATTSGQAFLVELLSVCPRRSSLFRQNYVLFLEYHPSPSPSRITYYVRTSQADIFN